MTHKKKEKKGFGWGTAAVAMGGFLALIGLKATGGGTTPPPPPPPPPPPVDTATYPFGIVEMSFGMSASIAATNYDVGVAGNNTTEVRVNNLTAVNIPVTLSFWTRPDHTRYGNPLFLGNVDEGIRLRTLNIDSNLTEHKGVWTIYTFGSTDATITSSNWAGKEMQFLASDTFQVL